MDLEARFLQALRQSRPAYDEAPDWRAGLALFDSLTPQEQAELDRLVVRMIDEDYRNPHASRESLPFDDVMVNLPAGMTPDDLLCVESAVLVAAARGAGEGFFAFNRLMRAPRWHAMFPRLYWLNFEGFEAQRRLGMTRAGRGLGALLGLSLGRMLAKGEPSGLAAAVEWAISHGDQPWPDSGPEAAAVGRMVDALLSGATKSAAAEAAGRVAVGTSLEGATGSLLQTDSLEECLTAGLAHGPGAAELAGALAGALYGPLAAPRRWTAELPDRASLEELAESLYGHYRRTR